MRRSGGGLKNEAQDSQYGLMWVGMGCAIVGNLCISLSFTLQRLAHKNNTTGKPYTQIPQWWLGLLFMAGGEVGNFLAYGMAPASLVSPLGAVTVVSNAILARVFLKEAMPWQKLAGVVLAIFGAVLIAVHAPAPLFEPVNSNSTISDNLQVYNNTVNKYTDARGPQLPEEVTYDSLITWRALIYIVIISFFFLGIANPLSLPFLVLDKQRKTMVIFNCFLCGLAGAITVTSSKGVSTAITQGIAGNAAMFARGDICWLTYLLIIGAVGSIVLQMKYLNEALMNFGSSNVVPVYYIVFTTITISAGMCLFLEIGFGTPATQARAICLFVLGLLLAFVGVYMISSLKEESEDENKTAQNEKAPTDTDAKITDATDPEGALRTTASREELKLIFNDFDKDKGGTIDVRELEALAEALGETWKADFTAKLFAKIDTDNSGGIDFDEFERWYHKEYDAQGKDLEDSGGHLSPTQKAKLVSRAQALAKKIEAHSDLLGVVGANGSVIPQMIRLYDIASHQFRPKLPGEEMKYWSKSQSRAGSRNTSSAPPPPQRQDASGTLGPSLVPALPTGPSAPIPMSDMQLASQTRHTTTSALPSHAHAAQPICGYPGVPARSPGMPAQPIYSQGRETYAGLPQSSSGLVGYA